MDIDPGWLETDFYAVLGVGADADAIEVTKAYRRLARELHPDTNPEPVAADRFKAVSSAYEVLRDPDRRAAYDQARRMATARSRRRPGGGYTIRVDNVADTGDFDVRSRPRSGADARAEVTGSHGGQAGDLLVTVHIEPHRLFGRVGDDLTLTVPVTYAEAALGADVTVPTLGGGPVVVRLPAGTPAGRVLRLRGRGLPTEKGRGDLLVTVHVDVPRDLDERQRDLIEQLARHDTTALRDHLGT